MRKLRSLGTLFVLGLLAGIAFGQTTTQLQVNLTWNAETLPGTYGVFRATTTASIPCSGVAQSAYNPIGSPTTNSFSDAFVTTGTIYCYEVNFSSSQYATPSAYSVPLQVTAVLSTAAPTPIGLGATVTIVTTTTTTKTTIVAIPPSS